MLFVDGTGFDAEHIMDLYNTREASALPNLLCFLNRGVIMTVQEVLNPGGPSRQIGGVVSFPEFKRADSRVAYRWAHIPFGDATHEAGANFGMLWFGLAGHLKSCVLEHPPLTSYGFEILGRSGEAYVFAESPAPPEPSGGGTT